MAQSIKCPTSTQVMISRFVGSSPASGSGADSSEPGACFGFYVSLSLCPSPFHARALSLSLSLSLSRQMGGAERGRTDWRPIKLFLNDQLEGKLEQASRCTEHSHGLRATALGPGDVMTTEANMLSALTEPTD